MASARGRTGTEGGRVLAGDDELGCVLGVPLGAQEAARGGEVMYWVFSLIRAIGVLTATAGIGFLIVRGDICWLYLIAGGLYLLSCQEEK